ncbi:MAG: hypothetical protein KBT48_02825 [Firmicutes bacterium]|nr:hypothetical protein [Bacillota bacterium]
MKIKEMNFRDVEGEICYISKSENIEKLLSPFDDAEDSTGFLGYGYVDYQQGLVFEVLCRAKKEEDTFQTLPTLFSVSVKISKEMILENEIELLEVDEKIYEKKIKKINDHTPASVKEVRELDFLDESRDGCYPDHFLVHFDKEALWVKVKGLNEKKGCLEGILLQEPESTKDVHKEDSIDFALKKKEDGSLICFRL